MRAKGHMDTEFIFDEMNQAAALSINLYAEHEFNQEENQALKANKRFQWPNTFDLRKLQRLEISNLATQETME